MSPRSPRIIRLRARPDIDLALHSERAGATLLEGWSDEGRWQIILPWPEETRELPWSAACGWKSLLRELGQDVANDGVTQLPFTGGWVGFISYEAAACEEGVEPRTVVPAEPPCFFARHRAGIAIAPGGSAFLFAPDGAEDRYASMLEASSAKRRDKTLHAIVKDSLGRGLHQRGVSLIREAISDGDVYQVNLTRSWSWDGSCDSAELYRALTRADPPLASAMIRGSGWSIVSASPELLLNFDRTTGVAQSRPIKGTIRRQGDDAVEIAALLASEKDGSEHLMIVDVVRNDFGKIAQPGRITVPQYRQIRSLTNIHHLESTVRAEGLGGVSIDEVLAALCPAASITGAPKRSAVKMIREIEPVSRGIYCGSIGVVSGRGVTFSVAIRTAVVGDTNVRYHAGGGIVWDSSAEAEDDECRAKASAFLRYMGEKTS
ncbi:MAG TPA: anthranilate synthase component I family protein [Thermoanaerobaculia bacterium]|nr:anthranilate synthase component I family protein [Thermoanaerobaculia bacterium]